MKILQKLKKFFYVIWKDLIRSKTKEKTREAFKKAGIFPVFGNITETYPDNIKEMIFESMIQYNHKKIYIIINSGGGKVIQALQFYDFLKFFSDVEIVGVVMGKCHSAALLILAGCNKRFALPNSKFLFHGMTRTETINLLSNDIENLALKSLQDFKELGAKGDKILKENFNLSNEIYLKISLEGKNSNRALSSEEAKDLGVIQQIIPKLPFSFKLKSSTT